MIPRKYWAAYDLETSQYMRTGINSKTKNQLVGHLFDWWKNANDEFSDAEVTKIAREKWKWIAGLNLRLDVQDTPFEVE